MNKNKKYMFIGLFTLVAILLAINGISYAKYASNSVWNYYLKSKGFYFNSEELSLNSSKNVNNMWDGGSTYFNISNNLNQSVVTEYDINYKVTCTIEGENSTSNNCYMNGTNSNVYEGVLSSHQACTNNTDDGIDTTSLNQTNCELGGYNWENQVSTKGLYFDVVNTEDQTINDIIVNITAESISPYSKVLIGKFILHRLPSNDGSIKMDYKNYSDYDQLLISNSFDDDRCIQVSWDSNNLLIDVDLANLVSYTTDSDDYINKIKLNIGAKNSLNYIFYKRNLLSSYDVSSFTLEELDSCN